MNVGSIFTGDERTGRLNPSCAITPQGTHGRRQEARWGREKMGETKNVLGVPAETSERSDIFIERRVDWCVSQTNEQTFHSQGLTDGRQ